MKSQPAAPTNKLLKKSPMPQPQEGRRKRWLKEEGGGGLGVAAALPSCGRSTRSPRPEVSGERRGGGTWTRAARASATARSWSLARRHAAVSAARSCSDLEEKEVGGGGGKALVENQVKSRLRRSC